MKELRELLREYNLGREHFAKLIGAGTKTVIKYEQGDETLTKKSREKIELGVLILQKYDLKAPVWEGGFGGPGGYDYILYNMKRRHHMNEVKEYDRYFKELFRKERLYL